MPSGVLSLSNKKIKLAKNLHFVLSILEKKQEDPGVLDRSPEPWIELMFKYKSFVGSIDSSDGILFGRAEPFVQFWGTAM